MAGFNGRDVTLRIGGIGTAAATLADFDKLQSTTITRGRTEVDTTDADENGWRSLLVKPGMKNVDLAVNGVMKSEEYKKLLDRFYDDANTDHYSVEIFHPNNSSSTSNQRMKESGKFFMQNLETGAEHSGAVTFSMTLLSSGEVEVESVANA